MWNNYGYRAMKSLQLLSLVPRRPKEFIERTSAIIASRWESVHTARPEYKPVSPEDARRLLSAAMGTCIDGFLHEPALATVEVGVLERRKRLPAEAPFGSFHNGDSLLGRFCYAACRALKPKAVMETGVCYGVTSSYLLQALKENGSGALHSIDLPPLGKNGDDYVGWLVPNELRNPWTLHRGTSGRLLPPLLAELGQIDLFIHDSLHTYGNMKMEFTAAWAALGAGGLLISDDVEGNRAFLELMQREDASFAAVVQERTKKALLGLAVKRG
jgi:hypothetical protein